MAKVKMLRNTSVSISMTVGEFETLLNAAFEYGGEVAENSIYDVDYLDRIREKAEAKLRRKLEQPYYLYRKA